MRPLPWSKRPPSHHKGGQLVRPITMLTIEIAERTYVDSHYHEWGQLVYASSGVVSVNTPQGNYLVPPQRAVWVPPLLAHEVASSQGARLASVYIEREESAGLAHDCCVLEVSSLLKELLLEGTRISPEYDWQGAEGRLFRTLRDQIATASRVELCLPWPEDKRLLEIAQALQETPEDPRSLEEWGGQLGASARTLTRLFQAQTGMGFRQWRQRLRLQQAIQLLARGDAVTQVALSLGYDSVSAFIHMFQQNLGVTPGDYLRQTNEKK